MLNDTTQSKLLHNLFTLLGAHRPAFKQERPFMRAVGLVLAEIFSFGRHTVTQGLLSLGIADWRWQHPSRQHCAGGWTIHRGPICSDYDDLDR